MKPEHLDEITAGQQISAIPQGSSWLCGVINMRGRVIPVFDLRRRLGLPEQDSPQNGCILIFSLEHHYVGMLVETIEETLREAVGNPISAPPGVWPAFIESVIPTSDGEFGLLVPDRLLNKAELEELGAVRAQF